MKLNKTLLLFLLVFVNQVFAQNINSTIRGKVTDQDTKIPLIGVNVILTSETSRLVGTTSDIDGNFELKDIPVGRHDLKFTYLGYQERLMNNIILNSGKQVVLQVDLEESAVQMEAVEIRANRNGEALNEMATVSARAFDVAETDRYAGSRGEPARMASNFAGVQGADDSRNDIVIRGNSPTGLLWRLEGIEIPNPNHFNIPGTAGGPVSIINNKNIGNSDFFTGAFPAEYGNGIAGVFDLRLRNGNNMTHELSAQAGFMGLELFGEGPMSKKSGSSYLFTYRYSTVSLFSAMGIDIGTDAAPAYQDASLRLNFPLKNSAQLALFGIGGVSSIDIVLSDQEEPNRNIFGDNNRDQYFRSNMGVIGATYTQPLNKKTFLKWTVAGTQSEVRADHDLIWRRIDNDNKYVLDSLTKILDYTFNERKTATAFYINRKINSKNTIKYGVVADLYQFNYQDSARIIDSSDARYYNWVTRWDSDGETAMLLQPYIQWKFRPNNKITINAGLHSQYFSLNGSISPIEPRIGMKYNLPDNSSMSFGYGLHSQLPSPYLLFFSNKNDANGNPLPYNKDLDFLKSHHLVLGHDRMLSKNIRLKVEAYYQHLFNIPVSNKPSSFSLVNTGSGFTRFFPDTLVNEGIGRNYGLEITLEKFFSKGYFFMLTTSLFDAMYQGSDGRWRSTDFNGQYAVNALVTKEWKIGEKNSIQTGTKVTTTGGRWYGPADIVQSNLQKELVEVDRLVNTRQHRPYFRTDLKLNWKRNTNKITHELGIDLVNVFDTQNILALTYAPDESNDPEKSIREEYQLGRLPIFYFRVDF